jgi:hypothetical protein
LTKTAGRLGPQRAYDAAVRFEDARSLLAALERGGVRYVLVGSMAMAVHGIVRATRDIDFFVRPDAGNVARLREALRTTFDDDVDEIDADDLAGAYPVIRYGPPEGNLLIDLIGRLGDAFSYDDIEFEVVDVDGVGVPVATLRMLYEMKRDTVRPQDAADAAAIQRRLREEHS